MHPRLAVPLLCALVFLASARAASAQGGSGFAGGFADGGTPAPTHRVWRATRPFDETEYFTDGSGRSYQIRGTRAYDLVLLPEGESPPWNGTVWLGVRTLPGVKAVWGSREQPVADAIPYQAYRGYYRAARHATDKNLTVFALGFTRKYQVGEYVNGKRFHEGAQEPAGTDLDWNLDTRFLPTGAAVETPAGAVVDRAASFLPKLTFSPMRAFYVDDRGFETVRRYEPSSLREKVLGGDVRTVRNLDYLPLGSTLRFAEVDVSRDRLWRSPPPAFQP